MLVDNLILCIPIVVTTTVSSIAEVVFFLKKSSIQEWFKVMCFSKEWWSFKLLLVLELIQNEEVSRDGLLPKAWMHD